MNAKSSKVLFIALTSVILILPGVVLFQFFAPSVKATMIVDQAKLNYTGHKQGSVFSAKWSPDGNYVVSGGEDNVAIIWDATTGSTWLTYNTHNDDVLSVDWSPVKNKIVSGSADNNVLVWNPNTGGNVGVFSAHSDSVTSVAWSPDGNRIATGSQDHTAKVWDWINDREIASFTGHNDIVNTVAWSPDNSKIASGGSDNRVRIWDASTADELQVLQGHGDSVAAVAWSPDGTMVVSTSLDGTAKIWNIQTGNLLVTFTGHDSGILSVDWFADGSRLITGGEDRMIRVWEVETGDVVINYTAHKGMVRSVSLSPDGKKIVSGADDHTSRIWSLNIPPPAPDLIISPVALPRSHTTVLKASVDYPDSLETLSPEFQFKEHSSSVWKDKYLSHPTMDDHEWEVDFTPDINASLGYYDFRVRIENEQQQSSPWTTETSPIEVVNNQPSAVIWSAPSKAFRGRTGTLGVAVSDVETPATDIYVRTEYSPVSVEDWNTDIFGSPRFNGSSGMWDCDFVFPTTSAPGAYRFRARCTDRSLGISDWDFLPNPISVANNLPSVMDFEIIPSTLVRGGKCNDLARRRGSGRGQDRPGTRGGDKGSVWRLVSSGFFS